MVCGEPNKQNGNAYVEWVCNAWQRLDRSNHHHHHHLLLGELPLRGAARLQKGRCCFWGISRCAGLLDYRKEDAASGGSPAARGCWIRERDMLFLGDLPLRGAAGIEKGRCCF